MLITNDFHNFFKMTLQILLASLINTLLLKTNLLIQILYTPLFEYVFLSDYSKLFLTNFMNTLIQVSRSYIKHSHNITIFHLSKNGFPFLYMTVLNVNAMNTLTWKFKLLLHNHFQNMLHFSTIAFQWTLKDLLILLHTTNPIYMS